MSRLNQTREWAGVVLEGTGKEVKPVMKFYLLSGDQREKEVVVDQL